MILRVRLSGRPARRCGAAALITRNPRDFPGRDIAIQTPAEFLATHLPP